MKQYAQRSIQQNTKGREVKVAKESKKMFSFVSLGLFTTLTLVFCFVFCCVCGYDFVACM